MRSRFIAIATAWLWLAAPAALADDSSAPPGAAGPTSAVPADAAAATGAAAATPDEAAPKAEAAPTAEAAPSDVEMSDEDTARLESQPASAPADAGATRAAPAPTAPSAAGSETDAAQAAATAPGETPAPEAGTMPAAPSHQVVMGEVGYDENGQAGRVHVVVHGDTLWDISDAYLGTPWVWPSIWKDNRDIENPDLIYPGDRIWITPTEMRPVSREEADRLLSARPPEQDQGEMAALEGTPAAVPEDSGPAPIVVPPAATHETGRSVRVPDMEMSGLVASEVLDEAASVVDSPVDRTMIGQGDLIYIGLGQGEVAVGDEFQIVRKMERVHDLDSGADLGYHVAILGWARVTAVNAETATALVRMSVDPIERGDPVLPRKKRDTEVMLKQAPEGTQGRIVFMPNNRLYMGGDDRVFLNRGSLHGLEVGTELEVYEPGGLRKDPVRGTEVQTPDEVIAHLVVVDLDPETATAMVLDSESEITLGDRFRPLSQPAVASR